MKCRGSSTYPGLVATSITLCAALTPFASTPTAMAQAGWPAKEVRLIAPFAPGSGGTAALAQLMAEKLREMWGQGVVLEHVPGSAGTIGVGRLAKSAPDGYTLVLSGDAAIVVAVNLYKSLSYDPVKDLAPIIQIGRTPNILVVNKERGPSSLQALVEQAKAKPGTITFNSTGYGTSQHIGFELLKRMANIDIRHVPSSGQTAPDILGGHVTASFMNILVALPHVRDGAMTPLGVSGAKRSPVAPQIPTIAEQGYPGFGAVAWFGLLAPAGTPDAVIRKVHSDAAKALIHPAFRNKVSGFGLELEDNSTPESFSAFIKQEIPRIGELVKASGIKL